MAGCALQTMGDRKGYLYDFFVSPHESGIAAYPLMELAIEQGADKLVICDDIIAARFFEQFGFEVVAGVLSSGAPPNWVRDVCGPQSDGTGCPNFLYMIRQADVSPKVRSLLERSPGPPKSNPGFDARNAPCANCGQAIENEGRFSRFRLFGGYGCERCGYLHVCGRLTMGPPL